MDENPLLLLAIGVLGFFVGILFAASAISDNYAHVEKNGAAYFCAYDHKMFRLVEVPSQTPTP